MTELWQFELKNVRTLFFSFLFFLVLFRIQQQIKVDLANMMCEVRSLNYIRNWLRPTSFLKINFRENVQKYLGISQYSQKSSNSLNLSFVRKFVGNLLEAPWLQYVTRKTWILIGTKLYFNGFWTVDSMKNFAEPQIIVGGRHSYIEKTYRTDPNSRRS